MVYAIVVASRLHVNSLISIMSYDTMKYSTSRIFQNWRDISLYEFKKWWFYGNILKQSRKCVLRKKILHILWNNSKSNNSIFIGCKCKIYVFDKYINPKVDTKNNRLSFNSLRNKPLYLIFDIMFKMFPRTLVNYHMILQYHNFRLAKLKP